MDLLKLDVVELANAGTVCELAHPLTGETLTDRGEEYKKEVDDIERNSKLTDEEKLKANEKLVKPKAFFVRMLGSDSNVYRSAIKRRFEKAQNKKGKSKDIDLDAAERKGAELLAKCTTECYMIENGKPVECTQPEMIRLYLKYPWLKEQAESHMADRSNLMES